MKIHQNETHSCECWNKEFNSTEKYHNHKEKMHDFKITGAKYAKNSLKQGICQKAFISISFEVILVYFHVV